MGGFYYCFAEMMNKAQKYTRAFGQEKVSQWIISSFQWFFSVDVSSRPSHLKLSCDFGFKDFNDSLSLFPFMIDEHQRLLAKMLEETYLRSQLISLTEIEKLDLIGLIDLHGKQKKYPFVFLEPEITMVAEKIDLKLRELEDKSRAHVNPEAAHEKFLLIRNYAESLGFDQVDRDGSLSGASFP